jgi:hypothetical protein
VLTTYLYQKYAGIFAGVKMKKIKFDLIMEKFLIKESPDFDKSLETWIEELTQSHKEYFEKMQYSFPSDVYSVEMGKRYAKVISTTYGGKGQRSAFAFVDLQTGDIYKPASWSAPAKGSRGNIYNSKKPLTGRDLYR